MDVTMGQLLNVSEMQCLQDAARKTAYPSVRCEVRETREISQRLTASVRHNAVSPLELERFVNVNDVWMPDMSQDG